MSKYDSGMHTQLDCLYHFPEGIATLRSSLVRLCDGDFCAAIILDDLYYTAHGIYALRLMENTYNRNYQLDRTLTISFAGLASMMSHLFDEQVIIDALKLIDEKDYIRILKITPTSIKFNFYHEVVDKALVALDSEYSPRKHTTNEEELNATSAPTSPIITPTQETNLPKRNESRRVEYHKNRASRVGLPATLTTQQWTRTLEHFNRRCALCPDGKYEVLEHFVPLICGGGTTEYNCIPACTQCNRIKHDTHPSMISVDSAIYPALQEVQKYLESRRMNVEAEQ